MHVSQITLKHFRCFENKTISFTRPLTLVEGSNGSGKTSLLEALSYACHLRSFRTRTTRELIATHHEAFSLKLVLEQPEALTISAGYTPRKRSVKINDQAIESYKQLIEHYRVITITDDDIALVKGSPEARRTFIDQALLLINPDYSRTLRTYAHILEQRNALLATYITNQTHKAIWDEKLDAATSTIRAARTDMVTQLQERLTLFLTSHFTVPFSVHFTFSPRLASPSLLNQELYAKHTLYGAHLDEYSLEISSHHTSGPAKSFASRGQQRLIALLLKVAQPALLLHPERCLFLLDDVISDLDYTVLSQFLALIMSFKTQVILTSPLENSVLHALCTSYDYERIAL